MANWIKFQELLNRWDIQKFEVVKYLKKGLQPYSKHSGRPLRCPQFCHLGHIYEDVIKTGYWALSEAEADHRELNDIEKLAVRLKESAEKELEVIKKDDPDFVSWKWLNEFGELAEYADEGLKKLFSYLDEAIFKGDDVLEFEKKHKLIPKEENLEANHQKVFPCRTGTNWKDVIITLIENEAVRIDTPQGSSKFSYHELGMSDKRSGNKPTMLWALFKIFAQNQGYIAPTNIKYDPKLPDTAKRLNRHLQTLFNIPESIFTDHYKKEKGYRTKIFFSDQTITV
jgi:hypothetical protein